MEFGIALVFELLALGLATGFLAGLLGVGGGMMLVPFLTLILSNRGVEPGMAVKMAIATAMATIFFTSLSSVRAHHQRGAVRWDLALGLAPGIVIGGPWAFGERFNNSSKARETWASSSSLASVTPVSKRWR